MTAVLATPVAADEDIAVMGLIAKKAIIRLDGVHHIVPEGELVSDGIRLIKIDDDRRWISLEIDGVEVRYRLGHGTDTAATIVEVSADSSGTYQIIGKINDISVPFIVDTGASLISLNKNIARQLGIDYVNEGRRGTAETANGLVTVYLVILEQVEIGDIKLNQVQAAVHDSDFPRVALLGMSFLNQVDMKREDGVLSLRLN